MRERGNRVTLDGFDPCAVLLNNDLSAGIPAILRGIRAVDVPPLQAGWAMRRKSNHFAAYDDVAEEFARLIGIDPWEVNPISPAATGQLRRAVRARTAWRQR